jgi:hypothetical protein
VASRGTVVRFGDKKIAWGTVIRGFGMSKWRQSVLQTHTTRSQTSTSVLICTTSTRPRWSLEFHLVKVGKS